MHLARVSNEVCKLVRLGTSAARVRNVEGYNGRLHRQYASNQTSGLVDEYEHSILAAVKSDNSALTLGPSCSKSNRPERPSVHGYCRCSAELW